MPSSKKRAEMSIAKSALAVLTGLALVGAGVASHFYFHLDGFFSFILAMVGCAIAASPFDDSLKA